MGASQQTALGIVAVQSKVNLRGQSVRRITKVAEILGFDTNSREIITRDVFTRNPLTDTPVYSGRSSFLERIVNDRGVSNEQIELELNNRRRVIEWMAKNKINNYKDVVDVIRSYYLDPSQLMKKIEEAQSSSSEEGEIRVIETRKGRRVTMQATGKTGFGAWKIIKNEPVGGGTS